MLPQGGAPKMTTLVPTGTSGYMASESGMCIRMHPWEAYVPIDESDGVPWMRIPGALRYKARVPSGLSGPGGIVGGSLAAHGVPGLTHVGFSTLFTTSHSPTGVVNPYIAV